MALEMEEAGIAIQDGSINQLNTGALGAFSKARIQLHKMLGLENHPKGLTASEIIRIMTCLVAGTNKKELRQMYQMMCLKE